MFTGAYEDWLACHSGCRAFADDKEPGDLTIGEVLVDVVPLPRLMAEQIGGQTPATTQRMFAMGGN